MDWVQIENEKCDACGICARSIPRCFSTVNHEIKVLTNQHICVQCGHCVAICPQSAIQHQGMNMSNFQDISGQPLISVEAYTQFIRERRSYRQFKKKEISEAVLNKLVDIVRYAPSGGNQQNVELIMVTNQHRIQSLVDMTVKMNAKTAAEDRENARLLKQSAEPNEIEIQRLEGGAMFREMLVNARKSGMDPIFYNAPAVAIFHTPMTSITPKDNCVIASTTMGLLGRILGVEYTYIAMFENTANSSPNILNNLNIPNGNKIQSVIALGYPGYKFLRTVDRKPTAVRWE